MTVTILDRLVTDLKFLDAADQLFCRHDGKGGFIVPFGSITQVI